MEEESRLARGTSGPRFRSTVNLSSYGDVRRSSVGLLVPQRNGPASVSGVTLRTQKDRDGPSALSPGSVGRWRQGVYRGID
jgi:hypothetical protein